MNLIYEPTAVLIAWTEFAAPSDLSWQTDTQRPGERLIEMAGRLCYRSWNNPAGRTNAEYIGNMLDHGHLSVIEHATATFLLEGISRSLTHELVRHRMLNFSQESQRYVPDTDGDFIVPDAIKGDDKLMDLFQQAVTSAHDYYKRLLEQLEPKYAAVPEIALRRKLARQAARAVLPNASETKMVVTGNFRAWRDVIRKRASEHADVEIRTLALEILRQLKEISPAVFGDFEVYAFRDGLAARSPFTAG